jgi:prepilin-type processing-associated H-X9-DG protein
MYSAGGAYGFPMLHGRSKREKQARFNYLFADLHVEMLTGAETVRDKTTAEFSTNPWKGGDYSWTIQPEKFRN